MNCGHGSTGTVVIKMQAASCPLTAECQYKYTQMKLPKKSWFISFCCNLLILAPLLTAAACHTHKCDTTWEKVQRPKIHRHSCDIWKGDGAKSCDMWLTVAGRSSVSWISAHWRSLRLWICHISTFLGCLPHFLCRTEHWCASLKLNLHNYIVLPSIICVRCCSVHVCLHA